MFLPNRFYIEDEEKYGVFPFKRGRPFKIGVAVIRECFQIFINGEHYTYFNHRCPNHQVAVLKCSVINGAEVNITNMKFFDGATHLGELTTLNWRKKTIDKCLRQSHTIYSLLGAPNFCSNKHKPKFLVPVCSCWYSVVFDAHFFHDFHFECL